MERERARVRAFESPDEPRVLAILQAAFGAWPDEIEASPAEFLNWKHRTGPFGESLLLVAELDGEVAGFAAYMPWRFRAAGRVLLSRRGVDYAVDPGYRRRGVSMALLSASAALADVSLIWSNPNEPTRRGGVSSGRREVGTVPRYARPCASVRETLRSARARGSSPRERPTIDAATAAELLADGEFVAHVLAHTPDPPRRWVTDKTLDFLRWRYGCFEEYRAVRCDSSRRGRGFAIFRLRRFARFWVLDVCELLAGDQRHRVVGDLLAQVSRAAAADFLSCVYRSGRHALAHGFIRASRGSNLMTRPLRPGLEPDPTRPDSWALSRGDLELL